jgi:A/G-specific adenine glycosylase
LIPVAAKVALKSWFLASKRDLPWRKVDAQGNRDPYATWISEMMLQQTQVATMVVKYSQWMLKFPKIENLAQASEADVLAAWAGLGYYNRARNLHKAAQMVMQEFKGQFPQNLKDMMRLPGTGPYTAGAVLSLAFNMQTPLLDGNLKRIFGRFYGVDYKDSKTMWSLAQLWCQDESPREINEGLMELGALVCKPSAPNCHECPLEPWCAKKEIKKPRGALTNKVDLRIHLYGVTNLQQQYLLYDQSDDLPILKKQTGFPCFVAGSVHEAEFLQQCNGEANCVGQYNHAITRYRITVVVFKMHGAQTPPVGGYYDSSQVAQKLVASFYRKGLDLLLGSI